MILTRSEAKRIPPPVVPAIRPGEDWYKPILPHEKYPDVKEETHKPVNAWGFDYYRDGLD